MRCFHRNIRCGERWRLLCSSRTFKKSEQKLRSLSSSTRFPAFWFFCSKPFSVPDKHGSQAARQHELGKQQQARRRFWGQREYQGERSLLHGKCFSWQERFRKTDRALEEVPTWPNVGQLWMTTNTEMIPGRSFTIQQNNKVLILMSLDWCLKDEATKIAYFGGEFSRGRRDGLQIKA